MHSPLATKIYYSQRNNRLRSALCHLYCESVASTKQLSSDVVNAEILSETMIASQASSQKDNSLKQTNNKVYPCSLLSLVAYCFQLGFVIESCYLASFFIKTEV